MLGLAGAGTLLPSLGGRVARADGGAIPKRIIFFYTEQGTIRPLWAPSAPNAPPAMMLDAPWSTTDHTLGRLHQPLVPYKRQLLFLDGIDMLSAGIDGGHARGNDHALTATDQTGSGETLMGGGISFDQFLAKQLNQPAPVTLLPSLEMYAGTGHDAGGPEGRPLYEGPGLPVPLPGSPKAWYDRLLPNGPRPTSPEDIAALAHATAQQRRVLDFTKSEFAALSAKLGKTSKERIDAHAAAIADLSKRMGIAGSASCRQPDRSLVRESGYESDVDVALRLTQTALACDLTRVVSLYLTVPPDGVYGFHPVSDALTHHALVHAVCGGGGGTVSALDKDPEAVDILVRYHAYNASQYAKLLGLLDSIPEADGGTLLDHTAILWCGQLACGDHTLYGLPYILGGGFGGTLNRGRYVRYPRKQRPDLDLGGRDAGPAHNDLFVALANRMGLPISTFGKASVCSGALAGLS
jgi:hypothetical protein